ncbi:alpha/beta hydrolase [Chromohalobacter sp. 11-W]|uniref:alpha/beta fold hydrolase n=1 Tax=Chromohalobacter sp. 11-W TaxID=2994061 RepID=UPI0024692AB8|nr:alpha/beta hydrolase [Chromohalobacter sp. 11-W]
MAVILWDALRSIDAKGHIELANHIEGGIVRNCGHYMPEEQPEEIGKRMIEFFKSDEN